MEILRVLSHTSWGADCKTLLRLHHSLILSKLSYGCEIYSSATISSLKMLDSVHHAGIRLATGAFKSSPIQSLLVDAGELSLDLYRQSSLIRFWYRLQRLPYSLACQSATKEDFYHFYETHPKYPQPFGFRVKRILSDMLAITNAPICPYKFSVIPHWKLPSLQYCKYFKGTKNDKTDEEIRALFLEHSEHHQNSVCIFTDGSKFDAGVGFGVYSNDFTRKGRLPSEASNYTAELYGILTSVKAILSRQEQNFTIFSDSKSALQSLGIYDTRHPVVLKILEWLFLIESRGKKVELCWVPAHVGVFGNEMADKLAKEAALSSSPARCSLPYEDITSSIRKNIRDSWQFSWDLQENNKMREITSEIQPWIYYPMPRRLEIALCRLRIGHTRLTHGFLMERSPLPYCEDCLVPLTVKHLIVECPSLGDFRSRYLSECQDREGGFLLAKALGRDCNVQKLFEFIEEAGLLNEI